MLKWTFNCFSKFNLDCFHHKWQFSVTNFWNFFSRIEMIKFGFIVGNTAKKASLWKMSYFFQLHRWEGLIYHIFSESAVSKWLSTWFMFSLSQILVFFCSVILFSKYCVYSTMYSQIVMHNRLQWFIKRPFNCLQKTQSLWNIILPFIKSFISLLSKRYSIGKSYMIY